MSGLQYFVGSNSAVPNDMTAALKPARAVFLGLVIERIMAFEAFRKLVEHGENPRAEMTKIADIAHKISGVAATLGFMRTGQLAAALDRAITENPTKSADPEHFRHVVNPLLEALLVEMEALLDD